LEFLNDFKSNLFSKEVYVFTPDGDMKILPEGATALDFAFDVHSEVGYHATAIKINNKLVPMGYKLQNGDQVSVTTNKSQKPTESWLKLTVTGKARSKIRSAMKEEKRKKGEFVRESLMRKMKNAKIPFEENIDFFVKHYGKKSSIFVNGESADQYEFSLAKCCTPVQGEDIFGYLTAGEGLKIHRTNCKNATHLLANYSYRVLKAEWSKKTGTNFTVMLSIIGVDSGPGVITAISNEISNKLGVNIRSFSIQGDEGYFEGKVSIFVKNKDQLSQVINSIKKLDGITNVTRLIQEDEQ